MQLKEIDRHTLASLVKRIWIYEGKRVEIEFYFTDRYRALADFNEKTASDPSFTSLHTANKAQNAPAGMERRT